MRKDTEEFLKSAEEDLSAAEELFRTKKYRIVVFTVNKPQKSI